MVLPQSPVVAAASLYVNGLTIEYSAAKVVALRAGSARDASNSNDILLPADASVNGAVVGANGVDLAVLVANTMYAVYVIGSSTSVDGGSQPNPYPVSGLLSLASNAAPYLPFGYDMHRRVGWVCTDSAANLAPFWQYDIDDQVRSYYWDRPVSVLSAGSSVNFASVALNTNLSPAASIAGIAVPPRKCQVLLDVALAGAATAQFRPYGSSATQGCVRFGSAGAAVSSVMVPCQLNAGVPTVQYLVSASNVSLLVTGFVDYLA